MDTCKCHSKIDKSILTLEHELDKIQDEGHVLHSRISDKLSRSAFQWFVGIAVAVILASMGGMWSTLSDVSASVNQVKIQVAEISAKMGK